MDTERFKKEFIPYHQKLYRIAFRIVQNQIHAEDIIQDTYIKLWEKRHDLDHIKNYESFIIMVLRNMCLDFLRSIKNKRTEEYNPEMNDITETSLSKQLEIKDNAECMKKLINELPEQQKQVIMFKDWDGYSNEEIEMIMGLSATNIRVILSRARKTVREQFLRKYGV